MNIHVQSYFQEDCGACKQVKVDLDVEIEGHTRVVVIKG